jgi:endonuclease/exonuclease/phosphatase family metal-dependent hydrolase
MRRIAFFTLVKKQAPRILGAVFCLQIALGWTSCDGKDKTPAWDTPGTPITSAPATPTPIAPPKVVIQTTPVVAEVTPNVSRAESPFVFIAYNVKNWLTMDRYEDGKNLKDTPKPDLEKQAVVQILTRQRPDVIGLCEIGTASDLKEIQDKLKAAGLDLPHSHYSGGSDPVRHLGLLSRFPITSTAQPAEMEYQLSGQTFAINRGVLDATVDAQGKSYRFIGMHLKSKRDSDQGDQEAIRLNEARLVRRHIDTILTADPNARLVVYGDFNDTRPTPAIKELTGKYKDPTYLTAIPAKDRQNQAWTYFWELHDIYSRIDFVMVSQGLRSDVNFPESKIIDDADWNDASDHRPVMAIFK